ncbi:protein PRRC1-like isoform X1 [Leptopilina boulardi]|uniref:protein PRRC1-like isoform X1 n=1 Tax=Leptopilina boulardi TaxID=63433 RepID=UPI0021F66285|nr:protein PRRC1-like isoform X1 [Leptopilina boulardi]
MTDESIGEGTFEFVEKRVDEVSISGETVKTDSLSSLSSAASLLTPLGVSTSTGSLLSSIGPPSVLPSFVTNSSSSQLTSTSISPKQENLIVNSDNNLAEKNASTENEKKNQQDLRNQPSTSSDSQATVNVPLLENQAVVLGAGLFSWVKETVVNSNVLSKVAEKAKNSVNSMITTLDPQMREFIYSGGDVDIFVASDKEVKVSSIREAFQTVFGKATVTGISVTVTTVASQPIGFNSALKSAEERISLARQNSEVTQDAPVVAVENFLLKVDENKWYDLGVILLDDPKNNVSLQTFTQMTPVPSQIVTMAEQATPQDYPHKESGLAMTVGNLLANNLQVSHNEWHHALTGVSRKDVILLAAKSLAGIYKNTINPV